ncbi:hypothetical protein M3202_00955 [Alkalihalobacillus oceani]|uniref:Uncharacterized protein n=1 Tax=Halalkalibacter oceani TaxID=1653776 RepID=A0A9X2DLU7_9BACI|nr:hypothetical protein [Halalkalibacter oceani]MCM3712638.1 hypothetical protein [Halalkalibacter oceani]
MEAFILLLISVCLLSIYGFIYVAYRLLRKVKQEEKSQFKKTFVILLFLAVLSGSSATWLVLP